MKKSKLTLGLVTGFVASLALSGCSSISKKDNSLLTYKGYDGTVYEIATDKMYDEYKKDSKVISNFYDRILEVLVRDAFKGGYANASKTYETIVTEAESNVKAQKDTASKNAKSNNTSYNTEWEKILESNGVESTKELKEKFIYDLEKEVLEDDLYKSLSKDGGLKSEWIQGALPYNVRHILAKVESGETEYTRGTISSAQAALISNIGKALKLGNDTFGRVAERLSEDGSASTWGDLGQLVTTKASTDGSFSMVAEFQLAVYIYDAIFNAANHTATGDADKIDALVTPEAKTAFNKLLKVPYEVFDLLATKSNGGLGDVEKRDDGTVVGGENVQSDQSAVYPRNILWNKYLNHHDPFLITNTKVGS
ncbi:MAG: peptidylprolyl isomerase, partial [Bacilli bacterium]|nr:peptidylprolyl isomerase [Bacilli bacterium]